MVQRGTRLPVKGGVFSFAKENTPPLTSVPVQRTESRRSALWRYSPVSCAGAKRKALRHKPEGFSLYEKDRVKAYRAKVLSAGMKVRAISTMSIAPIIGMIFLAMFMIGTSEIALAMKRFAP